MWPSNFLSLTSEIAVTKAQTDHDEQGTLNIASLDPFERRNLSVRQELNDRLPRWITFLPRERVSWIVCPECTSEQASIFRLKESRHWVHALSIGDPLIAHFDSAVSVIVSKILIRRFLAVLMASSNGQFQKLVTA